MQACWTINSITGFLLHPEPLASLEGFLPDEAAQHIENIAANLADLLDSHRIRPILEALPLYDVSTIEECRAVERAFQLYSFFASAYVFSTGQEAAQRIPAGVAVPLVALAEKVQRPPILSYASYTLANWQKIKSDGAIEVENLRLSQKFIHKRDAVWFTLIHVEIEAKAAPAIQALIDLQSAAINEDIEKIIAALETISGALEQMMATLKRMPEHCHPQVYYNEVRPYIFSFEAVVYEGVEKFKEKPQSFRGETGAQSSIIPALVQGLGIQHQENGLTQALVEMRDYMPKPHRDFLAQIDSQSLARVLRLYPSQLREAYNTCLMTLLAFRQMHLRFAASYIANQSPVSIGTGGTEFMRWLQQLIEETEAQVLND
jgi:indoleamine 2,3-dioxygenase